MNIVTQTDIKEYPLVSRGKVRDIYEISSDELLIITTDRMSAFDVVMNEPIPHKGVILNMITLFWMDKFADIVPNHLIEHDVTKFPAPLAPYADDLEGRSVIVKKARPLPIECIVRGYITGSGWKDYQRTGTVCGYDLPANLQESQQLPQPLFTPSTKADLGEHDENITVDQAMDHAGREIVEQVSKITLDIYKAGSEYAADKGIIIADTKFEFGMTDAGVILIDEVLTPDSSRFWPQKGYAPGASQPSFDKQYLRDWLSAQDWDKTPPPPTLPNEVIDRTRAKYVEAYEFLTGEAFPFK
ncbi:phosphoribosylaminoimidazolesuccinocarboxamide synthase [Desulfovibrio ferrophilus]|uniref:Phosphoribosylaminoimidazole-succinocarboxamide synthase n=1 Tax=Desulfovibrio ferrophilus TaxID=241368 RepID=A0A2Z6AYK2_9BACT|nr:phosphoribosylaminoimidazolesuccinocarboxamide synthase [Desulfovibrio ferrophilus]BBD08245.1 phosphoribosylaminoimidazole-succinocarboxamide synthase [Desulfovibrio ferrophilus]